MEPCAHIARPFAGGARAAQSIRFGSEVRRALEGLGEEVTIGDGFKLDASSVRRVTAVALVRDVLRAAILRGDLPGGSQLVQTEIAAQLDVSTTPVREAMRDLASEGLIRLDSHRVGIVRGPDWDEMVEIVEMRRALERVALERAMSAMTPGETDRARSLAEELTREEDVGSWVQKNIEFHSVFHRATKTQRLAGVLVALEEAGGVFVAQAQRLHPEVRKRAVDDHFALLAAFEARDLDRAVDIQHAHLRLPLDSVELESQT